MKFGSSLSLLGLSSTDERRSVYLKHQRARHRRQRVLIVAAFLQSSSKRWRQLLNEEGRLRRDRRLPRCALVEPSMSPWAVVYGSGNDQALITVTGFDHHAFRQLLGLFESYYYSFTPWTGDQDGTTYKAIKTRNGLSALGRPRKVTAESCLGLTLSWYRFKGSKFILQGWFGFTGNHANVWLRFGRRMLLLALKSHPLAKVTMPTDDEIREYVNIIERRHPALRNVYCVADGLKLYFQSTEDLKVQGRFYNGWQHGHFITNLFVFGADGRIIICIINAPGSVHDSTLAEWADVYSVLENVHRRTGAICCLDSAFASSKADFLIMSSEDLSKAKTAADVLVLRQATSLRQAAEWGMRAIQGAFPRVKDKIQFTDDGKERKVSLVLMCLLYNIRLELVGLNQIRNVYVPEWSKDMEYVMSSF